MLLCKIERKKIWKAKVLGPKISFQEAQWKVFHGKQEMCLINNELARAVGKTRSPWREAEAARCCSLPWPEACVIGCKGEALTIYLLLYLL